ncbi:MAG TPA: hypothetical protein VLI71_09855 [Gammaproteobacteria bacterium]|nr:hypothetical protein [Gammaproteobacteria bacterium]
MSADEKLDLMAPVQLEDGTTVWMKVGMFFPNDRGKGGYTGTVSILTLPVGATAPLRLYCYPARRGKETGGRPPRKTVEESTGSGRSRGNDSDPEGGDYGPPTPDDRPF